MKKILLPLMIIVFILNGCSNKLTLEEYMRLEEVQKYENALFKYKKAKIELYKNVPNVESPEFVNGTIKIYSDLKIEYDQFIKYETGSLSNKAKKLDQLYKRLGYASLKSDELFIKSFQYDNSVAIQALEEANKYMDESIELEEELNKFYERYIY